MSALNITLFTYKGIQNYPHWPSDLALWLTPYGSNYPCLEQIFMFPKTFEPSKFDYIAKRHGSSDKIIVMFFVAK